MGRFCVTFTSIISFIDFNRNNINFSTPLLLTAPHSLTNMDNPPKIPSGYADRTLRIIMVVAFFPALAFLSACVFSYLFVPTVGLIPMAASLTINIIALKSPKSPIRTKPIADAIVALSLLAVMVYLFVIPSPGWRDLCLNAMLTSP